MHGHSTRLKFINIRTLLHSSSVDDFNRKIAKNPGPGLNRGSKYCN